MQKKLIVLQEGSKECGSAALLSIIKYYGGNISLNKILELTNTTKEGTNFYNIKHAAREIGLEGKGYKLESLNSIKNISPPILCQINYNGYLHFIVIYKIKNSSVVTMDPSYGKKVFSKEEFSKIWTGYIMIFRPIKQLTNISENRFLNTIIFHTLQENKKLVLIIILLSVLFTLSTCIMSYHMQITLDHAINSSIDNLLLITIIFTIIMFIKNVTNYLRETILIYFNRKLDLSILTNTYTKLLLLPYNYYKNRTTGDIISRINDLVYIKNMVNKIIITVLLDTLIFIVGSILLFKINESMFFVLFIVITIYLVILQIFKPTLKKYTYMNQDNNAKLNSFLVESISSFETIKGISIEKYNKRRFEKIYIEGLNTVFKYNKIASLEVFLKDIVTGCGLILVMYLGTKYVTNGTLELSSFLTFNSLLIYFIDPIRNIIDLNREYHYGENTLKRINNLFEVDSIDIETVDDIKIYGDIKIKNLSFSFNGHDDVLANVNLNIEKSSKVLIMGPSGSGKSTILKVLLKYYQVKRNQILIDNIDINDISLSTIKNNICYISQDELLYNLNIKDNIILDREVNKEKFLKVCKIAHIDEIADNMFLGYDTMLEENGFNISGGQRQRIILGRTLVRDFNILLIDEGLNQIDINLERKILKSLFNAYKEKTIIIISHRTSNMDLYDNVIKFTNGKLIQNIKRNIGEIYE